MHVPLYTSFRGVHSGSDKQTNGRTDRCKATDECGRGSKGEKEGQEGMMGQREGEGEGKGVKSKGRIWRDRVREKERYRQR